MAVPNYERRSFSETAVATTLASGINDSDTTISINDATGWPTGSGGDFYIRIESETIRCESRTGTTLTVLADGRGCNGTTAASHSSGVAVEHVFTTFDADEANYVVSETVGKVAAAGDLLYGDGPNSLAKLTKGTAGHFLKQGASAPSWAAIASTDVSDFDEAVSDTVGAMFSDNTEDGITITYQDGDNTIDASVNVDDSTIEIDSGDLQVKDAGITAAKLNSAVAGNGLAGGGGSALSVNVDDSTIEINSDALRVKDGGITGAKLASAVVDGSTLEYNSGSLRVKDGGVTLAKLADEVMERVLQYTWKPATISISSGTKSGAGPHTLGSVTITDPGYDIEFFGLGTVVASGTALDIWQTYFRFDSTDRGAIKIPMAFNSTDQSFAAGLTRQTHSTGSNLTVQLRVARASGTGNFVIPNDGVYNACTIWWRRIPA